MKWKLLEMADLAQSDGMPEEAKLLRNAAGRIDELEAVIRFYFSLNPDTSDGTSEIGTNIMPMPDHVREIIIGIVKAAAEREAL